MAAKFVVISLLVASAYGSGGSSSFSYGVSDPNTGDVKDQHERREGNSVVGKYSLIESDGTKRIVEYSANPATGFNAIVRKEGGAFGAAGGLGYPGAVAHSGVLANPGALGHPGAYAQGAFAHPGSYNAHASTLGGNLAYGGYSGANAPQGVPAVSHYSNSVVHQIPHPYAGPLAGVHGGAYGGAYSGAAQGYGAYGQQGAFGAHGLASPLGHGLARPLGAHGYNGLTTGEAYPHGYGGYGARHGVNYGAGFGADVGAGLGW